MLPKGPVKIVVGGLIGAGIVLMMYHLLSLKLFLLAVALLGVEVWSFFNPYANDTISEVIWGLAERHLVPLLFGVATGWALASGFVPVSIEGLWISLCLGTLLGHFFWQAEGVSEEAE